MGDFGMIDPIVRSGHTHALEYDFQCLLEPEGMAILSLAWGWSVSFPVA